MTSVSSGGSTNTVTVRTTRAVNTVRTQNTPVRTTVERLARSVVDAPPTVVEATSPGVQGPKGLNGDAMGDNETFNENLALLYSVAKT